jgi:hypothetical protein
LNVHRVSNVTQVEIHIAEPLIINPCTFEFQTAIAKLKSYKSPSSVEIPAELIEAEGEILRSEIRKLINSISIRVELPDQWKKSIIVPSSQEG